MPARTARQIVALGGGGFSMEPDNPRLDRYILGLVAAARPRVCFVPTASGDSDGYVARFHEAFAGLCEPACLRLFARDVLDLRSFVLAQDILYVGGGNTANMLAVWRAHGLDHVLREAWDEGVILSGVSAGAVCWFDGGVTDSFGPRLAALHNGLGLVAGSGCPHYDGEAGRRPAFHELIARGELPAGLAADDGCGLHFVGAELAHVVASRPGAGAYRVEPRPGGGVVETPIPARLLD